MNINQALRRAKILKGRIAEWEKRSHQSNIISEGETAPTYKFEECERGREENQKKLLQIETAVAIANASNTITLDDKEIVLCEAIRRLSVIKGTIAWLQRLPTLQQKEETDIRTKKVWNAKEHFHDYAEEPYKKTCELDARAIQRRVDELQETFDQINSLVEGANHSINLSGLPSE